MIPEKAVDAGVQAFKAWEDSDDASLRRLVKSVFSAMLAELREPSETMIAEGADLIPCGQGVEVGPPNLHAARECWQAMIDAALSEQPQ